VLPEAGDANGQTGSTEVKTTSEEPAFGVATTMPADATEPTATSDFDNEIVDESMLEEADVDKYRLSWSPFRVILAALVVVGVPAAIFVYCGGARWAKRVFSGSGPVKGRYRRVEDEDLEK